MVAGKLNPTVLLIAAGMVAAGYAWTKLGAGNGSWAENAGRNAATAAVDMVDGVLSGSIEAIGETVGVPKTNVEQGRAALEAGNYWDASFLLPAGDFMRGVWKKWTD